jgi:tetratricopeptide (TPR) repeat protein
MSPSDSDHIDLADLAGVELAPAERRRMVRSLLARSAGGPPEQRRPSEEPVASGPARLDWTRFSDRSRAMAREREELPLLLLRFDEIATEERRARALADEAFHGWVFCEWLIETGRELVQSDAIRAEEQARLAVEIADRLEPVRYGAPLLQDLRARARVSLGDALRNRPDLWGADEALRQAEALLDGGTGDTLETGYLLEVRAALRRDQNRFAEAHRLADETIAVYRRHRELHYLGRAFVEKGRIYTAAHDLEAAVHWLRKGLGLLDPTRERSFELGARLGLMLCLQESSRAQEAGFLLRASRSEFEAYAGEILGLRFRWLEGKIQQSLGELGAAEQSLTEARRGFVERGLGFDAAVASLDLAGLYAAQSRPAEMRRVAEEMLPIFRAQDLHREAIAALIVFQQAVRMERVNTDLLREIRHYLERARKDNRLRFEYVPEPR